MPHSNSEESPVFRRGGVVNRKLLTNWKGTSYTALRKFSVKLEGAQAALFSLEAS